MTAKTSTTIDGDGAIVTVATEPAMATISFGRKNGLPGYSNEELSIFLQVPLDGINNMVELEKELDANAAFIKAWVYKQLGTLNGVDEKTGVVTAVQNTDVQAAPAKPSKPAAKRTGGKPKAIKEDKTAHWERLADATANSDGSFTTMDGERVWDNRENKRNPKAPDFKFADSGDGLWLDGAPEWFTGPAEGVQAA